MDRWVLLSSSGCRECELGDEACCLFPWLPLNDQSLAWKLTLAVLNKRTHSQMLQQHAVQQVLGGKEQTGGLNCVALHVIVK